jgi:uncharacterized protein YprB with RNaseH-like and TPR domain
MDNLLKRQLTQIKARARIIAGLASPEEETMGRVESEVAPEPAALPNGSASTGAPSTAAPHRPTHPIIEAAIRSGAVMRAVDMPIVTRLRRGPWWWRRRVIRDYTPAYRSRFETEFQELFAGMTTGEPLSIENAVPGEARLIEDSNYYLVQFVGPEIDATSETEATRFAGFARWPEAASRTVLAPRRTHTDTIRWVHEAPVSPDRILFLDIETAGLSANTYLFLVGMMYANAGGFHVEQVFARDYTEEVGVLRHVRETMTRFDTIVTYNGASFDLPFIRTRMSVHRLPELPPVGSVDLLQTSRRVFREVLPNCRLVTVERHLRGAGRVGDIPSRFIPRAYHEFVRTKDARIMRNVAYHNRMDLFTMAVILNHLGDAPVPAAPSFEAVPATGPNFTSPV